MTKYCTYVYPKTGQCPNLAVEGEDFCAKHLRDPERLDKKLYVLLNHRRRLRHAELSEHDALKSLKEEIAIARALLEERLNGLKSEADTIVAAASLNAHLMTIEKLVVSAHKLEQSMGALLNKPSLFNLANTIIQIILTELDGVKDYEGIIDRISAKIIEAVQKIGTKE